MSHLWSSAVSGGLVSLSGFIVVTMGEKSLQGIQTASGLLQLQHLPRLDFMKASELHISISGTDTWTTYRRVISNKVLFVGIFMWLHTKFKKRAGAIKKPSGSLYRSDVTMAELVGRREVGWCLWHHYYLYRKQQAGSPGMGSWDEYERIDDENGKRGEKKTCSMCREICNEEKPWKGPFRRCLDDCG